MRPHPSLRIRMVRHHTQEGQEEAVRRKPSCVLLRYRRPAHSLEGSHGCLRPHGGGTQALEVDSHHVDDDTRVPHLREKIHVSRCHAVDVCTHRGRGWEQEGRWNTKRQKGGRQSSTPLHSL